MVLRKKDHQISFLHVYHHSVMVLGSWVHVRFYAGDSGAVIGLFNAFVHIIMYTYYFLSGFGKKYARYLWWKKYVTILQMVLYLNKILFLCINTELFLCCRFNL